MTDKTTSRRIPRQARSRQRVDAILAAAADLFAEVGYETATTNAIAARADVSIGSLYQYFPNKDAILHALADQYFEMLSELHANVFTEDVVYLPLPVMLDRLIDPFITFHNAYPAFTHIFLGSSISVDLAAAAAKMDKEVIEQIKVVIQARVPGIAEERAQLMAVICKAVVKALLSLLEPSSDEMFWEQVSTEIKRLLLAYLEPILEAK